MPKIMATLTDTKIKKELIDENIYQDYSSYKIKFEKGDNEVLLNGRIENFDVCYNKSIETFKFIIELPMFNIAKTSEIVKIEGYFDQSTRKYFNEIVKEIEECKKFNNYFELANTVYKGTIKVKSAFEGRGSSEEVKLTSKDYLVNTALSDKEEFKKMGVSFAEDIISQGYADIIERNLRKSLFVQLAQGTTIVKKDFPIVMLASYSEEVKKEYSDNVNQSLEIKSIIYFRVMKEVEYATTRYRSNN